MVIKFYRDNHTTVHVTGRSVPLGRFERSLVHIYRALSIYKAKVAKEKIRVA